MRAAIKLVRDYFWPHARAALRQIGLSERHVNARRALRWIRARHQAEVSLKDIRRDALGQKLDAEETANLLAAMERSGWVRKKEVKTEGRSAWRWEVNPKLHPDARSAGSAERSRSASLSAEEWASCTSCTSCKPYRDQWRRRAREGEDMEEHARAVGVSQRTRDQQVASPEADPGDIPESPRRCAYCGQTSTAADPLHHGHWRPRKPDGDWLHTRCKDPWQAGGWRLK
jgi:hypothetical protein